MVIMVHTRRPITEGSSEEWMTFCFPDLVFGRYASDTDSALQILLDCRAIATPSVKRSLSHFEFRISYVSKRSVISSGYQENYPVGDWPGSETDFHLMPRLTMSGSLLPVAVYVFNVGVERLALHLLPGGPGFIPWPGPVILTETFVIFLKTAGICSANTRTSN